MLTFEKMQKYYFLNRMKFIEGSLINLLVRFLENIKNGCSEKDTKVTICYINIS